MIDDMKTDFTNRVLTTPVLYLAFNRPEKTQKSFGAIREARPRKLYVALDAPREGNLEDVRLNNQVKEIVKNIDWDCEVHYLIQEKNFGCSRSGVAAWSWVFSMEDRMIFIEDDGVPTVSFFYYCQELLERFKDDDRIAYIGGVNYGITFGDGSYFFSRECAATYAMATWKRVFDKYEYDIESYDVVKSSKEFKKNFITSFAFDWYNKKFSAYRESIRNNKRFNTYDCQMLYLVHRYNMYSIYPNVNMVSNIGLDGGANNHADVNSDFYKKYSNRPRFELEDIVHVPFEVNTENEKKMFIQRSLNDRSPISIKWQHLKGAIYKNVPFIRLLWLHLKK